MTFSILDFGFSISGDVAQAEHDLRLRQNKTAAQQEIEDAIVSQAVGTRDGGLGVVNESGGPVPQSWERFRARRLSCPITGRSY
jgi:hypothetical protein